MAKAYDDVIVGAGSAGAVLASRLSEDDWRYESEPEPHLGGRRLMLPRGRLLGRSSAIDAFVRATANSTCLACGTCRMGRGEDAVCDAEGRVSCLESLRVVDASLMPRIISGNISAVVIMMAEKIAAGMR